MKGGVNVTEIVLNFIIGIIGRIISSISATYLVRLFDKFTHKNNRHESK